jgi:hypothetical protein
MSGISSKNQITLPVEVLANAGPAADWTPSTNS